MHNERNQARGHYVIWSVRATSAFQLDVKVFQCVHMVLDFTHRSLYISQNVELRIKWKVIWFPTGVANVFKSPGRATEHDMWAYSRNNGSRRTCAVFSHPYSYLFISASAQPMGILRLNCFCLTYQEITSLSVSENYHVISCQLL